MSDHIDALIVIYLRVQQKRLLSVASIKCCVLACVCVCVCVCVSVSVCVHVWEGLCVFACMGVFVGVCV